MGNDFFNNHPKLGSFFDFDHDGSLDLGEATTMGGLFGAYANEMLEESKKAEREANESSWDDDDSDDDDYDYPDSEDGYGESAYGSMFNHEGIDTTSRKAIMKAVSNGDYPDDVEFLIEEALDNNVRFKPEDIIDLSYEIWSEELLARLIATSKPRFLQEHADELSGRWGGVELEYHEEAFDEEYGEDGTYYMNTPEEDWPEEDSQEEDW